MKKTITSILTILILSDARSAGLASLLYDVLLKKDDGRIDGRKKKLQTKRKS